MISPLKTTESTLEASNDGLPSMYEELNRKTLDAALNLVTDFENNNISPAQLYTGFNVLFTAISGLASQDVVEFAFEGARTVEKYSHASFRSVRTFFKKGAGTTIVSFTYGKPNGFLKMYNLRGEEYNMREFSADKLQTVIKRLIEIDYQELT